MLVDHAAWEGDAAKSTARAQVVTLHLIKQYIVPCINDRNLTILHLILHPQLDRVDWHQYGSLEESDLIVLQVTRRSEISPYG